MKVKLEELIKVRTGKLDANAANENGQYPFFTCSKEPLSINTYSYDCECVLVAGNGDLNVKYYNGKFDAYQRTYILESNSNKLYMPYLYFFMDKYVDTLRKQSIGGVIKYIKLENITNVSIELPEIDNQKYICNKIYKVKELINKHKKIISYLDTFIKARFVEMFGKRMENDEVMLSDIAEFVIGLTYKPENVSKNGTIVLRSGNILNNSLQLKNDVVRVSDVSIPKNKYIKKNDILMCSRNGSARLVGKSCLISDVKEDMSFGAFMTVIRSEYPYFLQSFFSSQYFTSQLTSVATTSVNQITTYMLNGYKTIKPTDDEENIFATFVKHIDKLKVA